MIYKMKGWIGLKTVFFEEKRIFFRVFRKSESRTSVPPRRYYTDYCGLHGLPLFPSTALSKQGLAMSLVNEFVDLLLSEPLIDVIQ
jgi:hypothetical protein